MIDLCVQNQSKAIISSHFFSPVIFISVFLSFCPLFCVFWGCFFSSGDSDNTQMDILQPEDCISVLHHLYFSNCLK